jgi:CRISPR-associated protein Cas5/CasD subtype I-E
MGVRIDRPGIRWWDYHTVGADMEMRTAEGKTKLGAMLTRREYLCDGSFLVALQGEPDLITILGKKIADPEWTLYLGRKCCPPSRPLLENAAGYFPDLISALSSIPWQRRLQADHSPETVDCLLDWHPTKKQPEAPADALVWFDVPITFDPPAHGPRFVVRQQLQIGIDISSAEKPAQKETPRPLRQRADYSNTKYRRARAARLDADFGLCVFCKAPASTVQHITYRRAGGDETQEDLRSLCRLCHDAVTMLEYGAGMGLDRINPEHNIWREEIIRKRHEIIEFRSLETRRRRLSPEEVE